MATSIKQCKNKQKKKKEKKHMHRLESHDKITKIRHK